MIASEHEEGRRLLARMSEALAEANQSMPGSEARLGAAAAEYIALMRGYIEKENGVLFPMGDGMLSEARQAALGWSEPRCFLAEAALPLGQGVPR